MTITANMQTIFNDLEDVIRRSEYNEVDMFYLIAQFADMPEYSRAIAMHSADVLQEIENDTTYTNIVLEVYRRTFFDPEQASKYSDATVFQSDEQAQSFVDLIRTADDAERRGAPIVMVESAGAAH